MFQDAVFLKKNKESYRIWENMKGKDQLIFRSERFKRLADICHGVQGLANFQRGGTELEL